MTTARAGIPLRGREREFGLLAELQERTREGHGGGLFVTGPAGIGKSAFLAAAGESAEDRTVLRISGVSAEKTLAGAGLHQLLGPLAGHLTELPAAQAAVLSAVLCDVSDRNCTSAPDYVLSLYTALTRLLTLAAHEDPILCCADDFDLLDQLSRDAVLFCARRLAEEPIVLLVAGRSPIRPDFPCLTLEPLSDGMSRRVLDDHVPEGLPQDLREELVALAAGNPLALVELGTSLTAGQLAGTEPAPTALPRESRLRKHFRERFDRLSPDAQQLVGFAVADEGAAPGTLARAAAVTGTDLRALEEATASGLLQEDGGVFTAPNRLVRSSLYAELSLAQRRESHELLARLYAEEHRRPQSLSHRAAIATRPDEALAAELDEAAAEARRLKDRASAARAYEQAATLTLEPAAKSLRLLNAAQDAWSTGRSQHSRSLLRRLRPLAGSDEIRGRAALLLGEIELRDGAPGEGYQSLVRAAEHLAGSDVSLAATALLRASEASGAAGNHAGLFAAAERATTLIRSDDSPLARLMFDYFAGLTATLRGSFDQAREPFERVVRLAGTLPDCSAKTWATLAALVLGDNAAAQKLAAQAVDAAKGEGDAVLTPWALEFVAHAALRQDRFTEVVTASVEGLRLAQVAGQHNSALNHLVMLAVVAAQVGDKDTTVARLAKAADEAATRGLVLPTAMSAWSLACLDLADDRPADALERLRPVITGADGSNPFVRLMATPQYVEAAVRCRETTVAREALKVFDDWALSTSNPAHLAISQRCQALVADGAEVDERFAEALRLHRSCDRSFQLAKTELFYGERLRRSRKPREARSYLRSAWNAFQRYEATYWTERARAELRAAGDTVDKAPATEGLTPQQTQISRLVAEGATNKEIAAQLYLSPRTVEHHLRNIFAKLGIRSRVELSGLFR